MSSRATFCTGILCFVCGCGSAQRSTEAPPQEGQGPAPNATPAAAADAGSPKSAAVPAPSADAPASPSLGGTEGSTNPDDSKQRTVSYHVTSTGLVIDVEGMELEPKAEPLRVPGGWGIKISVRAAAKDGHEHKLLGSKNGPLMVAREIDRGGGKQEKIGDERKEDQQDVVSPGGPAHFEREFKEPIQKGQSLTLSVGLWGLAAEGGDRRPVRKLFIVKMIAGSKKPTPIVSPPE